MTAKYSGLIREADDALFTAKAMHRGFSYGPESLRRMAVRLGGAVLLGDLGQTSVKGLARHFGVPDALIETLLQQADGLDRLDFVSTAVIRTQAAELALDLEHDPNPRIVIARTQPTSPSEGIRMSFKGKRAFGLDLERRTGTFDSLFATYVSRLEGGEEQSVNLGGIVPAIESDREDFDAGDEMNHLSALQRLSIEKPTEAMLRHAALVKAEMDREIPSRIDTSLLVFLQGRYEGREESAYLASPTRTVATLSEEDYGRTARMVLGDGVDIVLEAEGVSPLDPGLERRHDYVDLNGTVVPNAAVRQLIRNETLGKLDGHLRAEHDELGLILLQGELRAPVEGGRRFEGGQALIQVTSSGDLRWYVLLNKRNGARAWECSLPEKKERLQRLAEALAMLEGPSSTAGVRRREQYQALRHFNVPMRHPSGRENVWRWAGAARQSRFDDLPLGARLS